MHRGKLYIYTYSIDGYLGTRYFWLWPAEKISTCEDLYSVRFLITHVLIGCTQIVSNRANNNHKYNKNPVEISQI